MDDQDRADIKKANELKHPVRTGVKNAAKWTGSSLAGLALGAIGEEKLSRPTKTATELSKKYKINPKKMKSLIKTGAKVEKEHTKNKAIAKEIARDHIGERPDYYKRLKKVDEVDNKNTVPPKGTTMNPLSTYGLNEAFPTSTYYKLVHKESGKIIAQGSKKDIHAKMKGLNKKNPGSHFVALTSKKPGEVFKEEAVNEVLSKNASAKDYIHDFVHSKNKMFKGDSKKKRIKRALAAYYHKKKD